jgi:LCCL domain
VERGLRIGLMGVLVAVACGCVVTPDMGGPIAVGPPQSMAGTPGQAGGPIEAGCSFNAGNLTGDPGAVFQVACPPGCESSGGLWGTDVYTADSAICRAGIHAGAIPAGGGVVTVRIEPGRPAYRGSPRNGVQSGDYGGYGRSYAVVLPMGQMTAAAAPPAAAGAPQVIEAGCSFNSTQIVGAPGTYSVVSCPAGCSSTGGLWGTDVYTGDSAICRAAVHAGIITNGGGYVGVLLDVGQPAYRGSARNGVQSGDYGTYRSSFRLQRP